MSEDRTFLGLIEAREGVRIDERKLSARLISRIRKGDEMLVVFDKLKLEVEASKRGIAVPAAFLSLTGAFGAVGAVLGVIGLLEGLLPTVDAVLSLGATAGIVIVDVIFLRSDRRLRAIHRKRSQEVEEVSVQLDNALDKIYDEIVAELSSQRNPMLDGPGPRARLEP